jgi:hypothetical protein
MAALVAVVVFDRRQLIEVALDAGGELVVLGAEDAQVRLAAAALARLPSLEAESLRQPRPLGRHEHPYGAGEQCQPDPAHVVNLSQPLAPGL